MIRKRLLLALAVGIALVLLCVSAALADDPMKVSMELSTNKFSEPKTIKVSITVTNVGDVDMPGPVKLYYPSGKQVDEFGAPTLAIGASKNWSGDWTVTQKELEAGKITFKIRYVVYSDEVDEEGNRTLVNKTKNFSKKIQYTGADPLIDVQRTIAPMTARNSQEVSITYDVANTGSIDVSAVTIKENSSVSSKSGTIDSIPAGETGSYTFTTYMGQKDMTSSATISYKAGGKTFTTKVENATIKADSSVSESGEKYAWNCECGRTNNTGNYCGGCGHPAPWIESGVINGPEPAATPVGITSSLIKVGDVIQFGHYEQDNQPDNGSEPIDWIVLDVNNDEIKLISKYGLDVIPYNDIYSSITWETCSLRKWLNEEFYKSSFSEQEQLAIISNTAQDCVHLLSSIEASKYFKDNTARRCAPTPFAEKKGASTSFSYLTDEGKKSGWWWLQYYEGIAYANTYVVNCDGSTEFCTVGWSSAIVRPVIAISSDYYSNTAH